MTTTININYAPSDNDLYEISKEVITNEVTKRLDDFLTKGVKAELEIQIKDRVKTFIELEVTKPMFVEFNYDKIPKEFSVADKISKYFGEYLNEKVTDKGEKESYSQSGRYSRLEWLIADKSKVLINEAINSKVTEIVADIKKNISDQSVNHIKTSVNEMFKQLFK